MPKTITLHSLRHTYITYLMERGINPRRVQELAGHRTFATTWRCAHPPFEHNRGGCARRRVSRKITLFWEFSP
ncbi:MAG: hypothetical protein DRG31_06530 [Deltaproteobacteria bacterium]|nr:MAG: hypothetical protein DRG31_06530 [Deltaproteobacteria bacterium]